MFPRQNALRWALMLAAIVAASCAGDAPEQVQSNNPPVADPAAMPPSPRLALVLSSGGPRGYAHIGVLKVLVEAGLRPDIIVGTSSGALVGVLYAANPSPSDLETQALALGGTDVFDYDVFRRRVSGSAMQSWINGAIHDAPLDRLSVPVAVVATRKDTGRPVAFTRGDAGAAVRASSAVPGSWAPVTISGVTYIDGDIGAPLPIAIARSFGARHVIAVDVAQNVTRAPAPANAPASWTQEAIDRRVKIERESAGADVIIEPPLPYITGFSVDYRKMAIATGEAAARAKLPQIRALVSR
jgi:NTE family protein